ncbi:hypothetical protein EXIGLDRAFT_747661 [Exidia glandulosa HHB12029]|uniref:Ubiquitin 3 binding protein But2 C-terminal domain-containing protein n=1 Tax=Exidia glandulosa HHB12029 TaxID=1314781 RepID=A0A165KJ96_EXIGL|nr:hypothetical protein EXIGLDRAFT_747661 [Exidia glandulosa HHB12029]
MEGRSRQQSLGVQLPLSFTGSMSTETGSRYVSLTCDLQVAQPEEGRLFSRATRFLLYACAFSIFCSWMNLSTLQYRDAFSSYATEPSPSRRGNVYLGLENVKWERDLCRKRPYTYPTGYSVFHGDNVKNREVIHGHMDEVLLAFGGEVSALIAFYIPDFGLENCTISFRSVLPFHPPGPASTLHDHDERDMAMIRPGFFDSTTSLLVEPSSTLDIYVLATDASVIGRRLVGRLPLGDLGIDDRVSTQSFWCPNSEQLYIQAQCLGACEVRFGLQAMTTATSIYDFVNKTGFVITQHEHVHCS